MKGELHISNRPKHLHSLVLVLAGVMSSISPILPIGQTGKEFITANEKSFGGREVREEDMANRIPASAQQSGATIYQYDSLNRLTEITYADGSRITYAYDPAGNLTQTITRPR